MENLLIELCSKYTESLKKQSADDRESNIIYGEILEILKKNPTINPYDLLNTLNKGRNPHDKNKVRNRRDRITGVHKILEEANTIVNNLLDGTPESLNKVKELLKTSNIYRNKMVLSILLEEFYSDELNEVYYSIKNDQCKGFINSIIEKLEN